MNRFEGKVAVVTGGQSGIGLAIAQRLHTEGASVMIADLVSRVDTSAVPPGFRDSARVRTHRVDVTNEDEVGALFAATVEAFGPVDVVVANAGRGTYSPIVDHDAAEFRSVLDLCLTGVFLTMKHGAPVMNDGGAIVNISSLNGVQPSAGMSAYCAAKAGVIMLTKVAAMELGPRRIRVNAVGPGLIETPATGTFFSFPPIVADFVENSSVKRYGQPEEVASMVAYLCSDEASFVSGSYHLIDGGGSNRAYPYLPNYFTPPA